MITITSHLAALLREPVLTWAARWGYTCNVTNTYIHTITYYNKITIHLYILS